MFLFRYEDWPGGYTPQLILIKVRVVKETPCGHWVKSPCDERKRWVSKTTLKRFCYPTKDEAFLSFRCRKGRQIQILQNRLKFAEASIQLEQGSVGKYDVIGED